MRILMKVSMPVETGNELARKGALGSTIQKILEEVKPEAAYFAEMDGLRTGILIVNLKAESDIPALAEPFFLALNARVSFHPCMVPADLVVAGPAIDRAAHEYGRH